MTRPVTALREIVLPQVGPTSCSLISLVEMPATVARAERSWSPFRVGRTGAGGDAAGEADADDDGLADGEGEAEGDGAPATVPNPSSVRLRVRICTVFAPTIVTSASA